MPADTPRPDDPAAASGTLPPAALRPKDAARWLGIGQRQLWQLVNSHSIPHLRLGPKTILFPVKAMEDWLAERASKGVRR